MKFHSRIYTYTHTHIYIHARMTHIPHVSTHAHTHTPFMLRVHKGKSYISNTTQEG